MNFLQKIFGDPNKKELSKIRPIIDDINRREVDIQKLSDQDIRLRISEIRKLIEEGENVDSVMAEVFALVREASLRTLQQRHFDVQLMGGIILHQGKIAEMRTGEGKTLVATLPTVLNALAGKGVHVVTVNDYLAKRDAIWMGQVYAFLGLSVGIITSEGSYLYQEIPQDDTIRDENGSFEVERHFLKNVARQDAYLADITYGTNNEFGFDYLRDNMAQSIHMVNQRNHAYAIIDEVDSILIDEARTPLIISAPNSASADLYTVFSNIIPKLEKEVDYVVDEKLRSVNITESGIDKVETSLGISNIYEDKGITFVHHLEQALKAHALFIRDKDYVVKDGQVIIIDQFTGRMTPGRRFSEGLHQALEAKEKVAIQHESKTLATITYQNYFRLYDKIAGMTGTAITSAEEFHKVYDLDIVVIPTNNTTQRKDLADVIYKTESAKFVAIAKKVKELIEKGQPVLLGTASIEKSEMLAKVFDSMKIPYDLLNAKNHEAEGKIVADAGRKSAVTIATNMAGRGVDIRLGGALATPEEKKEILDIGGLYVIGTERHEARRIDNQLRGRSGRQGEPGITQFYLSLDDEVMRVFGGDRIKALMERFNFPDDEPIENILIGKAIENAQSKIEGFHFDSRKHLLEYDDVINKQREIIYRKRQDILKDHLDLEQHTYETLKERIYKIVSFHTTMESVREWKLDQIVQDVQALAPIHTKIQAKLDVIRDGEGSMTEKKITINEILQSSILEYFDQKFSSVNQEQKISIMRVIYLQTIDVLWMDHLEIVDYLKTGIRLRGYAQRDPLVEYKNEAFLLFEKLLTNIQEQYINTVLKVTVDTTLEPISQTQITNNPSLDLDSSVKKVGRNDPCPCGSGKKYKKCHGK